MNTTTATHPRYAAYLADYIRDNSAYLNHAEPAARLVGLQAMYDALDRCFRQENAPTIYVDDTTAQPRTLTRLLTRVRRVLR